MKIAYWIYITTLILLVSSCGESEPSMISDCGKVVIIDFDQYNDISSASAIFISDLDLTEDCLSVTLGYSGCNAGHEFDLITGGDLTESVFAQVHLKFRDNQPQECEAFFMENYEFDLSPLKNLINDRDEIRLEFPQDNKELIWEL